MSKRKRMIPLNEGHHCLLEDFATTRAMYFATSELDSLVGQALALHVNDWKEKSGLDLDGCFEWDGEDEDDIHLYLKSWALEDKELASDAVLFFGFGIFDTEKERDNELWISHFTGLAVEPLKVYYNLDGLFELARLSEDKGQGEELLEETRKIFGGAESGFHELKKKRELWYWSHLRLDSTMLAKGLDPEEQDLSLAFAPITKALEDFKSRRPALDDVARKARALIPDTE